MAYSYYKNRLLRNEVAQRKHERQVAKDAKEKIWDAMANIIKDPSKADADKINKNILLIGF